jgi:hypothetical protein
MKIGYRWTAIGLIAVLAGACSNASSTPTTTSPRHKTRLTRTSCSVPKGALTVTLSDTKPPTPSLAVAAGDRFVAIVPGGPRKATDLKSSDPAVARVVCSVLLINRGRRTVLLALKPGQTSLGATVTPEKKTDAAMPAWSAAVTVDPAAKVTPSPSGSLPSATLPVTPAAALPAAHHATRVKSEQDKTATIRVPASYQPRRKSSRRHHAAHRRHVRRGHRKRRRRVRRREAGRS